MRIGVDSSLEKVNYLHLCHEALFIIATIFDYKQKGSNYMKKILSAKEVSEQFFSGHVSYWKLLQMAKEGEIPSFRAGNRYLFHLDSLNEWIKAQESSLAYNGNTDTLKCS